MNRFIASAFLILLSRISPAQQAQPQLVWQDAYGGSGWDWAAAMAATDDGGMIVAGYSQSNDVDVFGHHGDESLSDFWIMKLHADGSKQWSRSLGGTAQEEAGAVRQTFDHGYVVAGKSKSHDDDCSSNFGLYDIWIVKLDSTGSTIEWQRSLGGTSEDNCYSLVQTRDSGYLLAGATGSRDSDVAFNHGGFDYWIVKLDARGNVAWQRSLGGTGNDQPYAIAATTDGGAIIAGTSNSNDDDVSDNHGDFDFWIVKIDSLGAIGWQRSLGGAGDDEAKGVALAQDGGCIVAGHSNSSDTHVTDNHGDYDFWIVKLDSAGKTKWTKSIGTAGPDLAGGITPTPDGGYMIVGSMNSPDGDVTGANSVSADYAIVKIDDNGNVREQLRLGGSGDDNATCVVPLGDAGAFAIAGATSSRDGTVTRDHPGGALDYDFWIVKVQDTSFIGSAVTRQSAPHALPSAATIAPNPIDDHARIEYVVTKEGRVTICVFDFLGRPLQTLFDDYQMPGQHSLAASFARLRSGTYLLNVKTSAARMNQILSVMR